MKAVQDLNNIESF